MTGLVWEKPPPPGNRSRRFAQIATILRSRPGEWARIADYQAPSSAGQLVMRVNRALNKHWEPAGAFQATYRTIDGRTNVYARYVGTTPGRRG